MVQQGLQALLVAAIIAVICFVPYLVYQYRRYGQFSASRLIWMAVLLVYGTALLTYTLAPLPTPAWCAQPHAGLLELDPTLYFRNMWQMHAAGQSWSSVLTSWTMLQMVLNFLLFIPLGIILRHLWKVGVWLTTLVGFCISLFIELTQLTGNWFTALCQYRVADISDVIINTAGALFGAAIALLIPRLAADTDVMEAAKALAKPVTRGRRWAGMLFDVVTFGLVMFSVDVVLTIGYLIFAGLPDGDRTGAAAAGGIFRLIGEICGFAVLVIASLVGSGASIGQRLVYLKPVGKRPGRVLRALVTQGVAVALLFWVPGGAFYAVLWLAAAVIFVIFRVRGLSFTLTGCDLADARSQDPDNLTVHT